jgi:biopolymer transport protein ExbB
MDHFIEIIEKCWSIWSSGGWVMVPLFLLAILIYASGIQMLLFMRRGNVQLGSDSEWLKWIYAPEQAEGRAGEIIRYTQENVVSAKHVRNRFEEVRHALLDETARRITFLNTLVAAAPLMGLLGTVIGMLATFVGLATGTGGETVDVVAEGISQALITTQTGLIIALPGVFLVLVLRSRKHAVEAALARIEALTLTKLKLD